MIIMERKSQPFIKISARKRQTGVDFVRKLALVAGSTAAAGLCFPLRRKQ